jgi:hypothetical protein
MSKYKTFLASFISSLLLVVVISQNRELFFFAKTTRTIEWTVPFGDPLVAISLLVALSFIPVMWLPENYIAVFKAWIATLLVAPLLATLVLFSDSGWGNILFQYVWAMVLGCLAGAVITLALGLLIRKWLR